ncbi:cytochrome P450 [Dendrothele bispora CBS 962.96]|uniref:Cytochrome P450 n=1 Tax=Dendrothele bispora (strain CBS 962.96) TaxID=1314807 RepID=A0A4S8M0V8_DENBC|nr:cytochrome P450 [Dendrothele bispora CBS 962.96]
MIPLVDSLILAACICALWAVRRRLSGFPLPPGPRRYPLVGNAFQVPRQDGYLTFASWKQKWGDYIYLKVFSQDLLVLNSYTVAKELLEKRGDHFSDRPRFIVSGELIGWNKLTAISPFGNRFKNERRLMAQTIGGKNAEKFWPVEEKERRKFLLKLFEEPSKLVEHLRRLEGSVILSITHGYSVDKNNDPLVGAAERCMDNFSTSTTLGAFMADNIPTMRFIPEWFPGGGFKKIAREYNLNLRAAVEGPWKFVKNELVAGKARPSFTSRLLTIADEDEELIKTAAFSLYVGGSDTAVSVLTIFFLLMILHPDKQAKAQAEIDALTGGQYLPTIHDRSKLPYTEALMLETLRWRPVAPLAFPHRCMSEDVFEGYRIPEGTVCIPNLWAMTHDPEYYADPMDFKPERFMKDPPELDPRNIVFGFGRRVITDLICPGRSLADSGVWLSIALVLATCNISKGLDANGHEVDPVVKFSSDTISRPEDFKYTVKPRSDRAFQLVKENQLDYNDAF